MYMRKFLLIPYFFFTKYVFFIFVDNFFLKKDFYLYSKF